MRRTRMLAPTWFAFAALLGCGAPEAEEMVEAPREVVLGPADGHDLPPADLSRVAEGALAPDFTAAAFEGDPVTLSQFRGEKNVLLVFYRGHW